MDNIPYTVLVSSLKGAFASLLLSYLYELADVDSEADDGVLHICS